MQKGCEVKELETGNKQDVGSLLFSPDSETLVAGLNGGVVEVWDAATWSTFRTIPETVVESDSGTISFSPDGRLLSRFSGYRREIWDCTTGTRRVLPYLSTHTSAFTPDSKSIVLFDRRKIHTCDCISGQQVSSHDVSLDRLSSLAISPDGRLLAFCGDAGRENSISIVSVIDIKTGHMREGFSLASNAAVWLSPLCFSSSGKSLAAVAHVRRGGGKYVQEWNVADGQAVAMAGDEKRKMTTVIFTPDDRLLAFDYYLTTNSGIRLYDVRTGRDYLVLRSAKLGGNPLDPPYHAVLSSDGKTLAAVHGDVCVLWDMASGREVARVPEVAQPVVSCDWHPSDAMIATSCRKDASIRLWRVPAMELVCTMYSDTKDGWLTFLPNGYYRASRRGVDTVSFVLPTRYLRPRTLQTVVSGRARAVSTVQDPILRAFPFDQFDLIFNRPDLVMDALGCSDKRMIGGAYKAYQRRLAKMGLSEKDVRFDAEMPVLEIDRSSLELVSKTRRVQVRVRATDITNSLTRFLVWANNVPLYFAGGDNRPGLPVPEPGCLTTDSTIPVDLATGNNRIQISVLNSAGMESPRDTVNIQHAQDNAKPSLWIAAIGVSEYGDRVRSLQYAAQDANDIVGITVHEQLKPFFTNHFAAVQVLKLVNNTADREAILGIRAFLQESTVDDTVMLFAAGHGFLDTDDEYYFGTHDIDPYHVKGKGISFEAMSGLLDGIPARRKLFLLDTCHAGELDPDSKHESAQSGWITNSAADPASPENVVLAKRGLSIRQRRPTRPSDQEPDLDNFFADLRRGSGASILAACNGEEFSVEGPKWGNGVFTYAVLECIRDNLGDSNQDGKISVLELQNYVRDRVHLLTNGQQNPAVRQENLADDFIVGGQGWAK